MIIQQTSVWCLSAIVLWVLSTPLLPNLNGDTGPKHRAINSYTTTGQFAAVSSAHKAGWLHNHSSVVPAAKTRAQSAPTTRPLHCTAHSSSSSQKDSAVQGQVGKKTKCEARKFLLRGYLSMHLSTCQEWSSILLCSGDWPQTPWKYLRDKTRV